MADVKWIKITTNMFDDEKIKLIESMPDKDTVLIIWIKLLVLAGKTNASGYLYLSQKIPYTDEMLATIFNRPLGTVRMALDIFGKFGMIEMEKEAIYIANWEKHQNIEGLEKIREQNRLRKQRQRNKEKQLLLPDENMSRDITGQVTQNHATEEDIEEDIEKDDDIKKISSSKLTPEKFYQDNFGPIKPFVADSIKNWIDDGVEEELIIRFMEEAVARGKANWDYVNEAIRRKFDINIKTLQQYESHEAERKRGKQKPVQPQQQQVKQNVIKPEENDLIDYEEFKKANGYL